PVLGLQVRMGFTVRRGSVEPNDRSRLNGRSIIVVVASAPTTRLSNAYAHDLNIRGRVRPLGGLLRQDVAGRQANNATPCPSLPLHLYRQPRRHPIVVL